MKIIECIPSLSKLNGAETLFVNLCIELSKITNLTIILFYNEINPKIAKLFRNNNIKYYFLGKRTGIDLLATKKFRKMLKKISPDIIHTHLCCLVTYFFSFGFFKKKWKLIHTVHNVADKEAPFFERVLRKLMLRNKILIDVAISDLIRETLTSKYKIKRFIPVIYNGIPLKNFNKKKKYDFIICARFVPEKNHIILMKALNEINNLGFFPSLICLGDGRLIDKVKKYVVDNNIKNVYFSGYVDDVSKYLSESKIFVLPSVYEGNPISILEAMNFGLPIIASKVGGIPDIIKDGINGFLISPGNTKELTYKMLFLLKSKKLIKKISSNNKEDSKKYSIMKCAHDYYDLFLKLSINKK